MVLTLCDLQVLVPSASNLTSSLSIVHQVPEGHVGVYWRGGALLKIISDPGLFSVLFIWAICV